MNWFFRLFTVLLAVGFGSLSAAFAQAPPEPHLLGSIIVSCGPELGVMTSFQVYEWYGTALPEYKYQMAEKVDEVLGIGRGKGCFTNDTVLRRGPAQAVAIFQQRIIRKYRPFITYSLAGRRITTGPDGIAVLSITEVAGPSIAASPSGSPASGSPGSATHTTAAGVQYSSADMSQFTRKPGAVSGYSTGAGAPSDKCSRCNGFGKINTHPNPCAYCGGTGGATAFVPNRTWTERSPTGKEYHYQSTEGKQQFVACTHCAGGPTPVWAVCPTCHGTGH